MGEQSSQSISLSAKLALFNEPKNKNMEKGKEGFSEEFCIREGKTECSQDFDDENYKKNYSRSEHYKVKRQKDSSEVQSGSEKDVNKKQSEENGVNYRKKSDWIVHAVKPVELGSIHKDESINHLKSMTPSSLNNTGYNGKEISPMTFNDVKVLFLKSSDEILLAILDDRNGFKILFCQNIERDFMAYILLTLGKAIKVRLSKHVNKVIYEITNSGYFVDSVQKYLASFHQRKSSEQYHLDSLVSLTEFLSKFQTCLPCTSSDVLLILLPQLKKICQTYLEDSKISECLDELDDRNSLFLEKYPPNETKRLSQKEMLQIQEPPENYRSLPILPHADDFQGLSAFIRPNVTNGRYQDVEHYLDVQFRLLREDYVKPLRDGVAEYLNLKKNGKSVKQCKDVRIYEDVHIISQQFVYAGLVHIALFNDANFVNIKWEYSKRFLTGSLLCFSDDEFKTMFFATVADRSPNNLKEGKLILRFEELSDEVLNLSPQRSFVVIETTAYFEAYRHNLKALAELNEANLPMKHYIVDVEKTVTKPQYLNDKTTYDMRPLLVPLDKKYVEVCDNNAYIFSIEANEMVNETDENEAKRKGNDDDDITDKKAESKKKNTRYKYPHEIETKAKSITVLDDNSWPSSDDLNLDPSQYFAIKSAITKEFSIIQGPPGTGKTYLGLRIVQLLLHNLNKQILEKDPPPILVVCYTNHALDQFLEGLAIFTDKIVRVGGRGKNEALNKFQLHNLKQDIKFNRAVPSQIFNIIKEKNLSCIL